MGQVLCLQTRGMYDGVIKAACERNRNIERESWRANERKHSCEGDKDKQSWKERGEGEM